MTIPRSFYFKPISEPRRRLRGRNRFGDAADSSGSARQVRVDIDQLEPVRIVKLRTFKLSQSKGRYLATAASESPAPSVKQLPGYAPSHITVSVGKRVGVATYGKTYFPPSVPVVVRQYAESEEMVARIAARVAELMKSHESGASTAPAGAVNPLAAARARGRDSMRAHLDAPDNLSLAAAAAAARASERHVNSLRDKGRLYALVLDGSARGYRYPEWQFAADPRRLQPVLAALATKGLSCWAIHEFMCRLHPDLKLSPKDAILDDTVDIIAVIAVVDQRFSDADQGAA